MTYHRGTLEEFNQWHTPIMLKRGLPNEKGTTAYSDATPHPANEDDYVWVYGSYPDPEKDQLSLANVKQLGWFNEV